MDESVVAAIVAFAGGIGGAVGSIVTVMARARVEQRRLGIAERREDRQLALEEFRTIRDDLRLEVSDARQQCAECRAALSRAEHVLDQAERSIRYLRRALSRMKRIARQYRQRFANAEHARLDLERRWITREQEWGIQRQLYRDDLADRNRQIEGLQQEIVTLRGQRRTGPLG